MRRTVLWLAIAVFASARCTSSHCSDKRPEVELDIAERAFTSEVLRGSSRDFTVYRRGEGPPVVIFHELPGLSPATFRLGYLISEAGFTVYLPLMFGEASQYQPVRNALRLCLFNRQVQCWNDESVGPIAVEMQALVDGLDRRHGSRGTGAIGMCLTGALPLELIARGSPIKAAVVAQPAMPLDCPTALAVPDGALAKVRVPIIATRFSEDVKSPRQRLALLEQALGDRVTTIEIDSSPSNPWGFDRSSHAVLTSWFRNEPGHPTRNVLDRAIAMFHNSLPR